MEKSVKFALTDANIYRSDLDKFIKTFNISTDDDNYFELLVDVYFDHVAACRGYRDEYGCPMEPDTPEHIEIEAIEYNGKDLMHYIDDLYPIVEEICENLQR